MPSLLLVVFLVQLLIYLVNSIGAKTINDLLWQLSAHFPMLPTSAKVLEQNRLRREVVRLKREMNAISAQDDFARWAKIRREHDKVLAEHDKTASMVSASRGSFDTKASAVRWVCTSGLRFFLQFWHGKIAMFQLPSGWFPWYVEYVLGFPRCPYGGVSINIWSMACANVISLVGDFTISALQLGSQSKGNVAEGQKQKTAMPAGKTKI